MSSSEYAAPLVLAPEPSPLLWRTVLLAHLALLPLVWVLTLGVGYRLLLTVLLLLSLYLLRQQLRRLPVLTWDREGSWWWEDAAGEREVQLAGESVAIPGVVILNFREVERRRRRAVVLLPDTLDRETLRRLRVRLRVERQADQSPEPM